MSDVHEAGALPAAQPAAEEPADATTLLGEGVPLALLVDLMAPEGPASAEILATEGMPDDAWWEPGDGAEDDDVAP